MKLITVFFTFLVFTVIKGMVISDSSGAAAISFPELDVPSFEFRDLSLGCGGFTDCIEYVGAVFYNIGLGLIFIVLLLVNLLVYIFEIFVLVINIMFAEIGGPWWVDTIMLIPYFLIFGVIIYKMVHSGSSED